MTLRRKRQQQEIIQYDLQNDGTICDFSMENRMKTKRKRIRLTLPTHEPIVHESDSDKTPEYPLAEDSIFYNEDYKRMLLSTKVPSLSQSIYVNQESAISTEKFKTHENFDSTSNFDLKNGPQLESGHEIVVNSPEELQYSVKTHCNGTNGVENSENTSKFGLHDITSVCTVNCVPIRCSHDDDLPREITKLLTSGDDRLNENGPKSVDDLYERTIRPTLHKDGTNGLNGTSKHRLISALDIQNPTRVCNSCRNQYNCISKETHTSTFHRVPFTATRKENLCSSCARQCTSLCVRSLVDSDLLDINTCYTRSNGSKGNQTSALNVRTKTPLTKRKRILHKGLYQTKPDHISNESSHNTGSQHKFNIFNSAPTQHGSNIIPSSKSDDGTLNLNEEESVLVNKIGFSNTPNKSSVHKDEIANISRKATSLIGAKRELAEVDNVVNNVSKTSQYIKEINMDIMENNNPKDLIPPRPLKNRTGYPQTVRSCNTTSIQQSCYVKLHDVFRGSNELYKMLRSGKSYVHDMSSTNGRGKSQWQQSKQQSKHHVMNMSMLNGAHSPELPRSNSKDSTFPLSSADTVYGRCGRDFSPSSDLTATPSILSKGTGMPEIDKPHQIGVQSSRSHEHDSSDTCTASEDENYCKNNNHAQGGTITETTKSPIDLPFWVKAPEEMSLSLNKTQSTHSVNPGNEAASSQYVTAEQHSHSQLKVDGRHVPGGSINLSEIPHVRNSFGSPVGIMNNPTRESSEYKTTQELHALDALCSLSTATDISDVEITHDTTLNTLSHSTERIQPSSFCTADDATTSFWTGSIDVEITHDTTPSTLSHSTERIQPSSFCTADDAATSFSTGSIDEPLQPTSRDTTPIKSLSTGADISDVEITHDTTPNTLSHSAERIQPSSICIADDATTFRTGSIDEPLQPRTRDTTPVQSNVSNEQNVIQLSPIYDLQTRLQSTIQSSNTRKRKGAKRPALPLDSFLKGNTYSSMILANLSKKTRCLSTKSQDCNNQENVNDIPSQDVFSAISANRLHNTTIDLTRGDEEDVVSIASSEDMETSQLIGPSTSEDVETSQFIGESISEDVETSQFNGQSISEVVETSQFNGQSISEVVETSQFIGQSISEDVETSQFIGQSISEDVETSHFIGQSISEDLDTSKDQSPHQETDHSSIDRSIAVENQTWNLNSCHTDSDQNLSSLGVASRLSSDSDSIMGSSSTILKTPENQQPLQWVPISCALDTPPVSGSLSATQTSTDNWINKLVNSNTPGMSNSGNTNLTHQAQPMTLPHQQTEILPQVTNNTRSLLDSAHAVVNTSTKMHKQNGIICSQPIDNPTIVPTYYTTPNSTSAMTSNHSERSLILGSKETFVASGAVNLSVTPVEHLKTLSDVLPLLKEANSSKETPVASSTVNLSVTQMEHLKTLSDVLPLSKEANSSNVYHDRTENRLSCYDITTDSDPRTSITEEPKGPMPLSNPTCSISSENSQLEEYVEKTYYVGTRCEEINGPTAKRKEALDNPVRLQNANEIHVYENIHTSSLNSNPGTFHWKKRNIRRGEGQTAKPVRKRRISKSTINAYDKAFDDASSNAHILQSGSVVNDCQQTSGNIEQLNKAFNNGRQFVNILPSNIYPPFVPPYGYQPMNPRFIAMPNSPSISLPNVLPVQSLSHFPSNVQTLPFLPQTLTGSVGNRLQNPMTFNYVSSPSPIIPQQMPSLIRYRPLLLKQRFPYHSANKAPNAVVSPMPPLVRSVQVVQNGVMNSNVVEGYDANNNAHVIFGTPAVHAENAEHTRQESDLNIPTTDSLNTSVQQVRNEEITPTFPMISVDRTVLNKNKRMQKTSNTTGNTSSKLTERSHSENVADIMEEIKRGQIRLQTPKVHTEGGLVVLSLQTQKEPAQFTDNSPSLQGSAHSVGSTSFYKALASRPTETRSISRGSYTTQSPESCFPVPDFSALDLTKSTRDREGDISIETRLEDTPSCPLVVNRKNVGNPAVSGDLATHIFNPPQRETGAPLAKPVSGHVHFPNENNILIEKNKAGFLSDVILAQKASHMANGFSSPPQESPLDMSNSESVTSVEQNTAQTCMAPVMSPRRCWYSMPTVSSGHTTGSIRHALINKIRHSTHLTSHHIPFTNVAGSSVNTCSNTSLPSNSAPQPHYAPLPALPYQPITAPRLMLPYSSMDLAQKIGEEVPSPTLQSQIEKPITKTRLIPYRGKIRSRGSKLRKILQ